MSSKDANLNIDAIFSWQPSSEALKFHWVHPCRVNDTPHLIHHPQLETEDPQYYSLLTKYASHYKWTLRADLRSKSPIHKFHSRRRKWLATFFLSISIASPATAQSTQATANSHNKDFNTKVYALSDTFEHSNANFREPEALEKITQTENDNSSYYNDYWERKIHTILMNHWQQSPKDPKNTAGDIQTMAQYFSQFPEVRYLFSSIEEAKWQLKYSPQTFETEVRGNALGIESTIVYFDPRSAAQFKFYKACTDKAPHCIASPADVLLHELLHLQSIAAEPQLFISQGGMDRLIYPYAHERQTIQSEKALYLSMTMIDGHPRPLRSEHSGRHVLAACVTCLK